MKYLTISIFAVIGFVAIITAFTNQPEQANQTTTPESHVWECYTNWRNVNENLRDFSYEMCINKVTGEMRRAYGHEDSYVELTKE